MKTFESINEEMQQNFKKVVKGRLLLAELDRNELFDVYINGFPEEFRQEHNCNCCKSFLRQFGGLFSITDCVVTTLWPVGSDMDKLVKQAAIRGYFFYHDKKLGTEENFDAKLSKVWHHFNLVAKKVTPKADCGSRAAALNGGVQTLQRALNTISIEAVDTVLELIAQNSLYRGTEHKRVLREFRVQLGEYGGNELYVWEHAKLGNIRNSVIGTLLVDISEGVELDRAVASFEAKVAPANYKRPKAIVTVKQLDAAEKELAELGLTDSLARRYAVTDDLPASELLFVNRLEQGSLFEELKRDVTHKEFSSIESVPVLQFLTEILPTVRGIEIMLENSHTANVASLIAPTNADAPSLFPWASGISWSYKSGVADSITARVKRAGGSVEGVLRFSLGWYNWDDLDLHVELPNGETIYYGHKRAGSGMLDVDMNVNNLGGVNSCRDAVENVVFNAGLHEGEYTVRVKNFTKRETIDSGFTVEAHCGDEIFTFSEEVSPANSEKKRVATFNYTKADGLEVIDGKESIATKAIAGLSSGKFHKVEMIYESPNLNGNQHMFFILDGAHNDETPRGLFNEMLRPELLKHKRVFEVLGNKMKVADSEQQLTGVGFSSTKRAEVILKLKGSFDRVIKVVI